MNVTPLGSARSFWLPTPRGWLKLTLIALAILLPFLVPLILRSVGGLPREVVLATGSQGGRYRTVSQALGEQIEHVLGVRVEYRSTRGSLENLELVSRGEVDFALYQPGTREKLAEGQSFPGASFVATLYRQPLFVVARRESAISSLRDLNKGSVNLGPRTSGDYAAALALLDHLGLEESDLDAHHVGYRAAANMFEEGKLDATFISVGINAPMLPDLIGSDRIRVLDIPFPVALTEKSIHLAPFRIPAGFFQVIPRPVPDHDIETVAATAQLIARTGASAELVEEVTKILHDQAFLKEHRLRELFLNGPVFSRGRPEFPLHPGATHFYEPTQKPFLRPEWVDATESVRSFVVSLVIAGFLVYRWLRNQNERKQEHRIDRYVRQLLEIERRQIGLDQKAGSGDLPDLQGLLDEVTLLRQDALKQFTAHQLQEDRGVECFIAMCHALSDKINAKISRQRLDQLTEALSGRVVAEDRG